MKTVESKIRALIAGARKRWDADLRACAAWSH